MSVDPLAEDFAGWTPYHYVHNNPINLIDPTGMSAYPPPEGSFTNGDVHNDSDGSWTFQDGGWYDNSSGEDNFLQGVEIPFGQIGSNNMGDAIPCVECHHTAVIPNGKKIDLTGNFGGLYINGIGGYNMGGSKIEGDHTTMNYDDLTLFGAGGAKVKGVLKSLQYLSSAFGAFSSLTASDQESVKKYSEGLKKDSVYTVQGTETGQGFYRSEVSNKAAADRVKSQYEKQGLNNVTVQGKEKKK